METIEELKDEGGVGVASVPIETQTRYSSACDANKTCSTGSSREITHFVTATIKILFSLTWKKLVDPRVMIGERTSGLEMTWMRKTSAIDRLERRTGKEGVMSGLSDDGTE